MARFRIGFSEEAYGYYYFDADSIEQAQQLIEGIDTGEIYVEDLPGVYKKTNGSQDEFISNVEEI